MTPQLRRGLAFGLPIGLALWAAIIAMARAIF